MTSLNRMLFRDLWHLRSQVLALSLVVACAVASYVSMHSTYRSLLLSRDTYYASYRFADLFAQVKRAPESVSDSVRRIPGVASIQTRIVFDVVLDLPGLPEPATGRMVSLPEQRGPMLNDICLRQGQFPEPGSSNGILVSEAFASANRLRPGDRLNAVINGRLKELRITGIALSPEYVYEVRGGGSILPDNRHFGVIWMGRKAMAPAFSMEGAFNSLALTLARGASEAEVTAVLDRMLARYGSVGAYGRDEQLSHRFLSDEIAQNRVSATYIPAVFLGIVAFLLHIILSRLMAMQRTQIGLLKAFGYGSITVGLHYLKLACIAVSGGAFLGTAGGWYLGAIFTRMYQEFYRFPLLRYEAGPDVVAAAFGITFLAAGVGAMGAVRRAMLLPPAVAMRPEPPPDFREGLLEKCGLARFCSMTVRMISRNIQRRWGKSCLTVAGISCAVAIVVIGLYFFDAIDHMMQVQFQIVQREDMMLSFNEPRSSRSRQDMANLDGVLRAEPFRAVPVRLRIGNHSKRLEIVGLYPGGELRQLVDRHLRPVSLPEEGLVLGTALAELLHAGPGEQVTVEVMEGRRPVRQVTVTAVVDEMVGLSAYMDGRALNRFMEEGGTISGGFLKVDPRKAPKLYALLKRTPAVNGIAIRENMLETFQDIIARSLTISLTALVIFACVIAFGMVYNGMRVNLSERGNELASLRVLGFTHHEAAWILLGEQTLLTMVSFPCGWGLGFAICAVLAKRMSTELYRMPLVISSTSFAISFLVVTISFIVSGLLIFGRIRRLDLVAVLKTRE